MATSLMGLPLAKAQALIATNTELSTREVRVLETVPPFVPKFRRPLWGELRVLRVRISEANIELIVSRELLGEEILTKETAQA